jgi:hypothetical protein
MGGDIVKITHSNVQKEPIRYCTSYQPLFDEILKLKKGEILKIDPQGEDLSQMRARIKASMAYVKLKPQKGLRWVSRLREGKILIICVEEALKNG